MKKEFEHVPNGQYIAERIIATWPELKTFGDAEPYVRQQIEQNGASYIKLFHELGDSIGLALPPPPMDVQRAVVGLRINHGVIAVGYAFSYAGAMALLSAGVDGLTHIFFDGQSPAAKAEFVAEMKFQKAHCSPTLALCRSQIGEGEDLQRFTEDPFAQQMFLNKRPGKPLGSAISQRPRSSVRHAYGNAKAIYEADIPILVGTDAVGKEIGTTYSLIVHIKMYLLVHEVGMSSLDVLRAAASVTADRFEFRDRGRIEVGRKADLALITWDALATLGDVHSLCLPVQGVWREGKNAAIFG